VDSITAKENVTVSGGSVTADAVIAEKSVALQNGTLSTNTLTGGESVSLTGGTLEILAENKAGAIQTSGTGTITWDGTAIKGNDGTETVSTEWFSTTPQDGDGNEIQEICTVTYDIAGNTTKKSVTKGSSIKFSEEDIQQKKGYSFSWTSADQEYKVGESVIITEDVTFTATYTLIPVDKVTISIESKTLKVGDTAVAKAEVSPEEVLDASVTWSSSDDSIVTVDENGNLRAVAAGGATITVTSKQDETKSDSVTITVEEKKPEKEQEKEQ
jgi:hypothetical protein